MLGKRLGRNGEIWTCGVLLVLALAIINNVEGRTMPKPKLGDSVRVFGGYPHLDQFMRDFIRRPHNEEWTFPGETTNIFKNVPAMPKPADENKSSKFLTRNLEVKLCNNIETLLKSYFNRLYIEGIHDPWKALNTDWSTDATAKRFGVSPSYLTDDYSFALLRVSRGRESKQIAEPHDALQIKDDIAVKVANFMDEGISGITEILMYYGSHYVTSFITGNSVYQVFVYERSQYDFVESELSTRGLSGLSDVELDLFFSPWLAVHQGKIQTPSRNNTVEAWAAEKLLAPEVPFTEDTVTHIRTVTGKSSFETWTREHLRKPTMPISRPSLMQLHRNETLLKPLGKLLQDEAILALRLEILNPFAQNEASHNDFQGYISSYIRDLKS